MAMKSEYPYDIVPFPDPPTPEKILYPCLRYGNHHTIDDGDDNGYLVAIPKPAGTDDNGIKKNSRAGILLSCSASSSGHQCSRGNAAHPVNTHLFYLSALS
jgi:hypothetical protein